VDHTESCAAAAAHAAAAAVALRRCAEAVIKVGQCRLTLSNPR